MGSLNTTTKSFCVVFEKFLTLALKWAEQTQKWSCGGSQSSAFTGLGWSSSFAQPFSGSCWLELWKMISGLPTEVTVSDGKLLDGPFQLLVSCSLSFHSSAKMPQNLTIPSSNLLNSRKILLVIKLVLKSQLLLMMLKNQTQWFDQ